MTAPPPTATDSPRVPRRRVRVASVALLAIGFLLFLFVRSQWFAHTASKHLQTAISAATGLDVTLGRASFSPTTLTVRVEDISIGAPGQPRLAHIRTLEVSPGARALLRGEINLRQLSVDGAELDARLCGTPVHLCNGPPPRPSTGTSTPTEPPFRDIAISDLHLRVQHDTLGSIDLGAADLDVVYAPGQPLRVGLLASGGVVHSHQIEGPVHRLEARLTYDLATQDIRVALARLSVGRIVAQVRDGTYGIASHNLSVNARLEAPVPDLLRFVPNAPRVLGDIALDAVVTADIDHGRFDATSGLDGRSLAIIVVGSDRSEYRYSLGESVRLHAHANAEQVEITNFDASYAGATIRSPRVTIPLGAAPTIDGRFEIRDLDFTRLMADTAVTPRTKILWNLNADAHLHGTLNPLRLVLDLPLVDTREFAVLRDFFNHPPQHPLIHIPRARISGQMLVDPETISFVNMAASFGRSHLALDRVRIRLSHEPRDPDLIIDGFRSTDIHFDDIGTIADLPVTGVASAQAELRGHFEDPLMTGSMAINGFSLAGLPFGNLSVSHWFFRKLCLSTTDLAGASYQRSPCVPRSLHANVPDSRDFPIAGHHRRTDYTVHQAFLDFGRYALVTGARIHTDRIPLEDFYNMFHFEGDPTFEPFDGVGTLDANVDYVLGRPGDDPDGVMTTRATLSNWDISAFDQRITDASGKVDFIWLRRREGARGARTHVTLFQGHVGAGLLGFSGTMDPGGQLHFLASATEIPLSAVDLVRTRELPVSGTAGATVTVEGSPEAPRITADATLSALTTVGRQIGSLDVHLQHNPEGPSVRPGETPPTGRLHILARGLDDQLRVDTTLRTPWTRFVWRDLTGIDHHDHQRAWGQSELSGAIYLLRPVDAIPWLPPSLLARLGPDRAAFGRFGLDIEHASLSDPYHPVARLVVDSLTARVNGLGASLSDDASLDVCLRDGFYWLLPPSGRPPTPLGSRPRTPDCGPTPAFLTASSTGLTAAPRDPFRDAPPQVLGPDGTRLWMAGGGTLESTNDQPRRFTALVRAEADLSHAARLAPSVVSWGRGIAVLQASATGSTERVTLDGSLRMDNAAVGLVSLPTPVENINLSVRLRDSEALVEHARAQIGTATVDLSGGFVRVQGTHLERIDVPVVVRGLALTPDDGIEVALDADTHLRWQNDGELPLFSGDVDLTRARYTRPIALSADLSGRLRGPAPAQSEARYDPANDRVRLDLRVRTRAPVRVVNNLLDADLTFGDDRPFRVLGTNQRLGLIGSVNIPRGLVRLYENDFEVRRGRIDFDNPERIAPNFDLTAQTDIRRSTNSNDRTQWRVQLHAHGNQDQLALDMSAEPALAREDIVLLLLFGLTRTEMERLGTGNTIQAIAVEAIAAATGIGRALRSVIPLVDDVRIGSAYNPRTFRTEPQVTLGQQITDRVRIGASVTASDQPQYRATTDFRFGQGVSVQAVVENANNQPGSQIGNVNAGVDMRFRVEFE